ncbi:prophage antirepressor [Thiovulum sp. ES]|nr:prophage antirepressor [Thiovulum sp. ES]
MNLITKNFNTTDIRILLIDGREYFVAKDTALLLGYSNTNDAISRHCKKAKSVRDFLRDQRTLPLDLNGVGNLDIQTKLIPESDVWRLVIKSKLPETEKIEEWIMEEVLPSIRKTGSYSLQKSETNLVEEISLSEIVEQTEKAVEVMKLLENRNAFELFQIDQIAGKFSPTKLLNIDFSQTYFLPTEIGKILGISGAEVNLILEKRGFQFRDENGIWRPTSSGKEFCLEIGNQFNQLKWRISTIL